MQCILKISIPHYYPTACLGTSQHIFLPTSSSLFMNACKQQGTALRFLRPKFLWMGRDRKSHSPWHCLPSVWMLQGCQSSNFSQGVNGILLWKWGWIHPLFFYDHTVLLLHFFCFRELQQQSYYLTVTFHVQNSVKEFIQPIALT